MYNSIQLLGNLGKDPEVRQTNSGKKVANFSLATSEKIGDTTYTDWHDIVAWEKLAEVAEKYLTKGSKIFVQGRLKYQEYEKDSVTIRKAVIVVGSFKMLDSKKSSPNQNGINEPELVHAEEVDDDLPF